MSLHTPAPILVQQSREDFLLIWEYEKSADGSAGWIIGEVWGGHEKRGQLPIGTAEANARLWAASPKLYEFAQRVRDHFGADSAYGASANYVLALAEGRAP